MLPRRAVYINQPALFPWLGEFEKVCCVDLSICLDSVAFQKNGYLTRFRVLGDHGARWLTVPSRSATRKGAIARVEFGASDGWFDQTLSTLAYWYRRAPFRQDALDLFAAVLRPIPRFAVDGAERSLATVCDYLGLPLVGRRRSSALATSSRGSRLLLDLIASTTSTHYVFGPGSKPTASHYLDWRLLEASGIALEIMRYMDAPYDQGGGREFVPRCSVLDAIAWRGRETRDLLASHPVPLGPLRVQPVEGWPPGEGAV